MVAVLSWALRTIGRRNPFPSNWLDLSVNPIVKIESLYDGDLMWESASVHLKDGAIWKWDSFHGGGGWRHFQDGAIFALHLHWSCAVNNLHASKLYAQNCLELAESSPEHEGVIDSWNSADRSAEHGALHALRFLLYWLNS